LPRLPAEYGQTIIIEAVDKGYVERAPRRQSIKVIVEAMLQ
jgi:hypothetical protein